MPLSKKLVILFCIASLHPAAVWAGCRPIDLTDPGYLQSKGKGALASHYQQPRDQDGVGWCYAFAASDSLSHALGYPVSSLDLSVSYYHQSLGSNSKAQLGELYGGLTETAMNAAQADGVCPESVIPSNVTASSNLGYAAIKILMQSFQVLHDQAKARGVNNICVQCSAEFKNVISPSLPGATPELLSQVIARSNGSALDAFHDLMRSLCSSNRRMPKVRTDYFTARFNRSRLANLASEALEKDEMPSIEIDINTFAVPNANSSGSSLHAMVITGQTQGPDGQCRYTIRNSWGRSCYAYNAKYAERCDAGKGTFWMTEEELKSSAYALRIVTSATETKDDSSRRADANGSLETIRNTMYGSGANNVGHEAGASSAAPSESSGIGGFFASIWRGIKSLFSW